MDEPWAVFVGGQQVVSAIVSNENFTYFYLTYSFADGQRIKTVEIEGTYAVSELASIEILPLFMAITLILIILTKKLNSSSDRCRTKMKIVKLWSLI